MICRRRSTCSVPWSGSSRTGHNADKGDEGAMARRNLTNGDTTPELSEQQQTACDLIVAGRTLQDVAEAVGVARPTVSRWMNHEPVFIAAVNARRQELWESTVDDLRGLIPQALQELKAELAGETPLKAAIEIMRAAGFYGSVGRPDGPTEAEDVKLALRQKAADRLLTELSVLASEP
jgi:hypothetical protein